MGEEAKNLESGGAEEAIARIVGRDGKSELGGKLQVTDISSDSQGGGVAGYQSSGVTRSGRGYDRDGNVLSPRDWFSGRNAKSKVRGGVNEKEKGFKKVASRSWAHQKERAHNAPQRVVEGKEKIRVGDKEFEVNKYKKDIHGNDVFEKAGKNELSRREVARNHRMARLAREASANSQSGAKLAEAGKKVAGKIKPSSFGKGLQNASAQLAKDAAAKTTAKSMTKAAGAMALKGSWGVTKFAGRLGAGALKGVVKRGLPIVGTALCWNAAYKNFQKGEYVQAGLNAVLGVTSLAWPLGLVTGAVSGIWEAYKAEPPENRPEWVNSLISAEEGVNKALDPYASKVSSIAKQYVSPDSRLVKGLGYVGGACDTVEHYSGEALKLAAGAAGSVASNETVRSVAGSVVDRAGKAFKGAWAYVAGSQSPSQSKPLEAAG